MGERTLIPWVPTPMFHFWRCQRTFNSPPHPEPANYSARRDSHTLSPLLDAHGSAVKREKSVVFRVSVLLKASCPTTIGFAIWAIVVLALQRVLRRWLWSHISEKVSKVAPSLANLNPSSSVSRPRWLARICAARVHRFPCSVFASRCQMAHAVNRESARRTLPNQTSTGLRAAIFKTGPHYRCCGAAIAKARPHIKIFPSYLALTRQRGNRKPIEFSSGNVLKVLAGWWVAWNDFREVGMFQHIGFSGDRSLTGAAVFALQWSIN